MSINDILNDKSLIPFLLIILMLYFTVSGIVYLIKLPFSKMKLKKINTKIYGEDDIDINNISVEDNVTVIRKASVNHPMDNEPKINVVIFELSNGARLQLAIKNKNCYGSIMIGDKGRLEYQGRRFINFRRYAKNNP